MNNSKFVKTEGYPLTADRLQELQTTFQLFNTFGGLAGDLTIVSGCKIVGTTIQNGSIIINGELLEFREATFSAESTVIIYEENVSKDFKNGTVKEVYAIRYASIGTAETSWPWAEFKRLDPIAVLMSRMAVLEKKAAVFQVGGGMVLWNKPAADIPTGWREVEEWRARMPIGFKAGDPDFGDWNKPTGGGRSKTLSIAELPPHSHSYSKAIPVRGYDLQDRTPPFGGYEDAETTTVGNGKSFSILNPYRIVIFIEYIG